MRLAILSALVFSLIAGCYSEPSPRYPTPSVVSPIGGSCLDQSACGEGSFCLMPMAAQCGQSGTGDCAPFPVRCSKDYTPVCGCDGKSYGNACVAYSYGVSLQNEGVCDEEPSPPTELPDAVGLGGTCGTRGANPCGEGLFCSFSTDAHCGETDAPGECKAIPVACTRDYRPACGCDGKTHSNECTAHAAGTSTRHAGACKPKSSAFKAKPVKTKGCVRGGCSGELCLESGAEIASLCRWKEEYACYKKATCERQQNGKCGWKQSPELRACTENNRN